MLVRGRRTDWLEAALEPRLAVRAGGMLTDVAITMQEDVGMTQALLTRTGVGVEGEEVRVTTDLGITIFEGITVTATKVLTKLPFILIIVVEPPTEDVNAVLRASVCTIMLAAGTTQLEGVATLAITITEEAASRLLHQATKGEVPATLERILMTDAPSLDVLAERVVALALRRLVGQS